jgi:hypothetical protein
MKLQARWIHLILGLLIATTLAIVSLTVYWNLVYFPPEFTGWGEVTRDQTIAGWAINRRDPTKRVQVQLYIDDQLNGQAVAELPRPDVVQAGWTRDERCGYVFPIPALGPGVHEARIYGTYTVSGGKYVTLLMTGEPLRFQVNSNKNITPVK